MSKCIYTGADEATATFLEQEHIFPKCIGGVRCLPLGWVSDEVNSAFSKIELKFARENPLIVIPRMFSPSLGRKKHTNREKVSVMRDTDHGRGYSLGFVRNGTPTSLDQLIVATELQDDILQGTPVYINLAPRPNLTHEQQIKRFWRQLAAYNGHPSCIKDSELPLHTYLLGVQDSRWFLALPENEEPERIMPRLAKLVAKVAQMEPERFLSSTDTKLSTTQHHVESKFSFCYDLNNYYQVSAKIAINCLAALKGVECVTDPALDGVKEAILTGVGIDNYASIVDRNNPALTALKQFAKRLPLGQHPHCVTFVQDNQGMLFALVTFFGTASSVLVRLGSLSRRINADCYICDWENNTDYTMIEAVVKICKYDKEETLCHSDII